MVQKGDNFVELAVAKDYNYLGVTKLNGIIQGQEKGAGDTDEYFTNTTRLSPRGV